ncbi:MAG: hypothetical protein ABEJ02_02670 [Candidatus Paceibacteria bacterium]
MNPDLILASLLVLFLVRSWQVWEQKRWSEFIIKFISPVTDPIIKRVGKIIKWLKQKGKDKNQGG